MLKNYIKIAFRNLLKNKGISFINITGLAIALSSAILILLHVQSELSFDMQHSKADRIFRVLTIDKALGVSSNLVGITLPALGPAMKEEFPEVEETVRFSRSGRNLIEYENKTSYTSDLVYAEPNLFKVFDFKLVNGDANTALTVPNTGVITQTAARKIFGNENPLGKTFKVDNNTNIEVVGVLEDIPAASHLAMDVVISLLPVQGDSNYAQYLSSWGIISMTTYVLLNNPSSEKTVEAKLEPLIRKNNVGKNFNITLQPLKDVHLRSSDILFDEANRNKSDIGYIYSLIAVAFFIIIIAALNFMNLSTARAAGRAKEVGLRKVIGAVRQQLISQYIGESVFLSFISLCIALIIVEIFAPAAQVDSGPFEYFAEHPTFLLILAGGTALLGFFSGIYPAFVLSKFQPIIVLKGTLKTSRGGIWLRRVLVVIQFTASIGMIIGTYIVYQQLDYIRNKNAGYNREQVLIIDLNDQQLQQNKESLKNEIKNISGVSGVSFSSTLPGRGFGRTGIQPEGYSDTEDIWILSIMSADEEFIPNMGMEMVEGRNFSKAFPSDSNEAVIINEAAVKALEWKNPAGKKFNSNSENPLTVIGVVKDFHFASMRHRIEPLIIVNQPQPNNTMTVRIKGGKVSETISMIENAWGRTNPNHPFEYTFLDEEFDQLYRSEQKFARLIVSFTWLAIFIACLGLFGLSSYMTEQRTKEIGIRKVLGASIANIFILTTNQFLILVALANIIAWPLAYLFMNKWLQDFAYRVEIRFTTFFIAAFLTLIIALLTVGYQAVKAAVANPVKSLRYE
ncbi:MAG: ABC transporter permease [Ignavibacteria bacterium]